MSPGMAYSATGLIIVLYYTLTSSSSLKPNFLRLLEQHPSPSKFSASAWYFPLEFRLTPPCIYLPEDGWYPCKQSILTAGSETNYLFFPNFSIGLCMEGCRLYSTSMDVGSCWYRHYSFYSPSSFPSSCSAFTLTCSNNCSDRLALADRFGRNVVYWHS